jgi:hypothetical protein
MRLLGRLVMQEPEQGALSTLFATTSDIPGGSFVWPGGLAHMRGSPEIATPSRGVENAGLARSLWDLSAGLTSIDSSVRIAVDFQ